VLKSPPGRQWPRRSSWLEVELGRENFGFVRRGNDSVARQTTFLSLSMFGAFRPTAAVSGGLLWSVYATHRFKSLPLLKFARLGKCHGDCPLRVRPTSETV
jgi:hypothetical protein